jgi:hypothetical protein
MLKEKLMIKNLTVCYFESETDYKKLYSALPLIALPDY